VFAQQPNCEQTTCSNCVGSQDCGWCSPTQQCLPGSVNGPTNATCLGVSWQFGKCLQCETFTDCRQCLENPADCGWCTQSSTCGPLGGLGACPVAHTCPCPVYKNCDQCTQSSSCQWCLGDGSCSSVDATCTIGPGYNKTTTCPCTVYKDCASCSIADSCKWCQNLGCEPSSTTNCLVAPNCNGYCSQQGNVSCTKCNSLNGCGWCSKTRSCVDIQVTDCLLMHNCENCEEHKYCDPCTDDSNCIWCETTRSCQSQQWGTCNLATHTCPTYCQFFKGCSDCNNAPGCGWCNENSQCIDVLKGTCQGLWVHTCELPLVQKCGFDGGAFVGGMFLVIGLIVLAALAYIIYRWKTGRKILYTELR